MKSVGIRGSVVAAVAGIFVLGCGVMAPVHAQEAALAANPELAARGVWNPSTAYAKDDIVTARGSAWIAKRANTGKVPGQTSSPSSAAFWQLFARGFNPTGAWSNTTLYQPDDLVTFNGQTFRAKRTKSNSQPAANAFWELLAQKGDPGPNTGITAGTQGAPAISFNGDADTGIFSPEPGKIAMVENGALFLHNLGTDNTALGTGALNANTTGSGNTAVGSSALAVNTTGAANTAVGDLTLVSNTTGQSNTALGSSALFFNTTGASNSALGGAALAFNTTGSNNTGLGRLALLNNTTGNSNTAVGVSALSANTLASFNTAVGRQALGATTTGGFNTAVGFQALSVNTTGSFNNAFGPSALGNNTSGGSNIALGSSALASNTTGSNNIAIGAAALDVNTTGGGNIAIGINAADNPTNPSNSIFIGSAGLAPDTLTIKIGTEGTQTSAFIAGIFSRSVDGVTDTPVIIDNTGKLGTAVSSRRYKFDIESMADVSAMLGKLRPVTFRYKETQNGRHPLQYGLIAEEVAETFPDLAVFNTDGSAETVKYHLLPSFLLAGYQAQQNTIAAQEQKIEALTAREQQQVEQIATLEQRLRRLEALLPQSRAAALQ